MGTGGTEAGLYPLYWLKGPTDRQRQTTNTMSFRLQIGAHWLVSLVGVLNHLLLESLFLLSSPLKKKKPCFSPPESVTT